VRGPAGAFRGVPGGRGMRVRWLVWLVAAWSVAIAAVPPPSEALPLPPASAAGQPGDVEAVRALLAHRLVRAQLAAAGLSDADVDRVWARLTPEERAELAARLGEVGAGGQVAAVLAVAIIVAMAVILVLELIGRRVISRP
jgi:hypothetical protein